jgi:hypothetical protein
MRADWRRHADQRAPTVDNLRALGTANITRETEHVQTKLVDSLRGFQPS